MPSHRAFTAAAAAALLAVYLTACAAFPTDGAQRIDGPEESSAAPTPEASDDADIAPDDEAGAGMADAFAERDAFIAAQQQPLDGSPLVAKTPEQMELVAQQRAYFEEQGAEWSADAESVTLALALDACETSILNGHAVDVDVFRMHVTTSPLIDAITGGDPAGVEGAVSIMVFGTGFICPADAPQWESAWTEAGGVY